jgi:hypothetical protein
VNEDMLPPGVDVEEDELRPGEFYTSHGKNEPYEIPPEAIDVYNKKTKQWESLVPDEHRQAVSEPLSEGAKTAGFTSEKEYRDWLNEPLPQTSEAPTKSLADMQAGYKAEIARLKKERAAARKQAKGEHQVNAVKSHYDPQIRLAEERLKTAPDIYAQDSAWLRIGKEAEPAAPQPAGEGKGEKLYGGGPDIEDIARLATPGLEAGRDIKSGIQSLLFPGAQGPEHLAAAEVMGHQLGSKARDTIIQATALKPFKKMFDKLGVHNPETPIEQNVGLKAMSDLSTGRPLSGNLEKYRYIRDKLYNKLLTALDKAGVALETVRENYFPGMWTKESRRAFNQAMGEAVGAGRGRVASEGEADKTVMDLNDWSKPDKVWVKTRVEELMKGGQGSDKETLSHLFRRPLKGSEAFRKAKTFDDIMTGAEFGLKPISNNPVDLDLLKMEEMGRSLMINRALREWEPKGDVVNVDNSGRPLRGRTKGGSKPEPLSRDVYEKIKDRHGDITTRDPDTHQLIKIGERWAKKPVADILNNYLASGLVNNRYFGRAYRGWMAMGNLMNQAQLGLGSMFHVGFTAGVAQIKAHANVVQDLYGLAKGNRSIADLAKTVSRVPTAMARPLYKGSRVLTEHASPTVDVPDNVPVGQLPSDKAYQLAYVNKAVEMAGGAFRMEKGLRTSQSEKMMRDWRSGVVGKGKAILRSPVALSEASMWPTMVAWVPRVKATTIADSMLRIRDMNPGKTMMELRPQFRQAWNLIDQAAGQVQYDRTFIHRAALNFFQLFTRAPGWSGGSFALFGGALKDTGTFFKEWAKTGKAPENLPPRVAFTISTIATTAAINGLMTYMFTGEKPHGMDWWAFRDGGKDKNGTPTRMVLPTYSKELFSWFKNAPHTLVAKMHPLLSLGISFVRGRDYYNNMIWNEEKGIFNKDFVLNVGGAYIRGYEPFWTRGIGELADREGGLEELLTKHPGKLVAPEFGVMPATRAYTATKSDEIMDRNAARHPTVRTPEEAEKGKGIREAEQMKLAGHEADYQKQLKKLQLSPQQAHNIETKMKNVKAYRFKGLPVDVAVEAYQAGTPEEKAIYGPLLRHKINNLSDRDRAKYRQYRDFKKQIEEDEAASHVGAIDTELKRREARP